MSAALLVIDVQQSFEQKAYWDTTDLAAFQQHQLALIAGCQTAGVPIVHIFHVTETGVFSKASGWVKPMVFLPPVTGPVFEKHVHNALLESGLLPWLHDNNISKLIISGIRTEQCCETTARVAFDLGFTVDFVTEAMLTFAMQHADGTHYSTAQIRKQSELVLAERFARICSVQDALASLKDKELSHA